MTAVKIGALAVTTLSICAILGAPNPARVDALSPNVDKAIHWLVSVQGRDGGWGQDGGETSFVRTTERLESKRRNSPQTTPSSATSARPQSS
jgi:hypothetical protein